MEDVNLLKYSRLKLDELGSDGSSSVRFDKSCRKGKKRQPETRLKVFASAKLSANFP
jgi:hypothetical protein